MSRRESILPINEFSQIYDEKQLQDAMQRFDDTPSVKSGDIASLVDVDPDWIYKVFVTCVIKNSMNQLLVLRSSYSTSAGIVHVSKINYETVEERFGKCRIINRSINLEYTETHKLQKDLGMFLFLLSTLLKEARRYGTCFAVIQCLENLIKMYDEEAKVMSDYKAKRRIYNRLQAIYRKQKRFSAENIVNSNVEDIIKIFYDEMENVLAEMKYIQKWQNARVEQNLQILEDKENKYINTSKTASNQIENEKRCHETMAKFLIESRDEYLDQIESWMEVYDKELEKKDADIINLKVDIDKKKEKYLKLDEEYARREKAIEDYLEHKRIKKAEAELLALKIRAVCKIQAWWRGLMVRLFLGRYKKLKKKFKKGSKKGSKKVDNKKKKKR